MKRSLLCILISICSSVYAQQDVCNNQIQGVVVEADTQAPISGTSILLPDLKIRLIANEHGGFKFTDLCNGTYRLVATATGYKTDTLTITLPRDKKIVFRLSANVIMLNDVEVVGHVSSVPASLTSTTLGEADLNQTKGSSIADVVKGIAGVTTFQTGNNIAKPVIHGLHSNRILMLNNGIRQEGQQWGVEHAPEIDPFIASQVTVIKGAESIRYGAEAMGGVVIVEAPSLSANPNLHGELNLVSASNGKTGVISAMAGGGITGLPKIHWRLQGTAKRGGNTRSAEYYLDNTGVKENNFSGAVGYDNNKVKTELYFSHFGNTLGIYSGAHIGSLNDLLYRLEAGRPSEDGSFTYGIGVPSQHVTHDLLKVKTHWHINDHSKFSVVYGLQWNNRKEYDVRRGGRSNIPSLDMRLTTQNFEGSYELFTATGWKTIAGLSGTLQVNNNVPGTGVTPLIPNFDSFGTGVYAIERLVKERFELEAGIRFDHKSLDALGYDTDKQLYGGRHTFNNFSGSLGGVYHVNEKFRVRTHLGSAWRSPTVNELYSNGLHHGVAAIERGLNTLKSEQGYKWMNSAEYFDSRLSLELGLYTQYIRNYIYLQPSDQTVVSLRGTFPVFDYRQTDATFTGFDATGKYAITGTVDYEIQAAVVRARDVKNQSYLPWIPADQVENRLRWHPHTGDTWQNGYLELQHRYVSRQKRYEPESDYAAPPPAYQLLSASVGTNYVFNPRTSLTFSITVNNLTNTLYKDYMNRFRYYTHDIGRNFTIRTILKF